jgi:hypothetical protein
MTDPGSPLFEHLSDLATVTLAVIGGLGIIFTFFQLDHAGKSRLAATYLNISKEWDGLVAARTLITDTAFTARDIATNAARGALVLNILDGITPFEADGDPASIENDVQRQNLERSLDTVLSYLEDLGLLCRRGYAGMGDIADIIGPSIAEIVEIMLPYIEQERRGFAAGGTVYANTLWLYERVAQASQFSIGGYGAPSLFFRRRDGPP